MKSKPTVLSRLSIATFVTGALCQSTFGWVSTTNPYTFSGNVGIGTESPTTKLEVQGNLKFGNQGDGVGPNSLVGGYNCEALGNNSVATGISSKASGHESFAIGSETHASNYHSFAGGYRALASGHRSFAFGDRSESTGTNATAWGISTVASGNESFAIGSESHASNYHSFAGGYRALASGHRSFAFGDRSEATTTNATAFGDNTKASGQNSLSLGRYTKAEAKNAVVLGAFNVGGGNPTNWVAADPVFEIGMGTDDLNRANALTVFKNGNVGIATFTPSHKLEVNGTIRAKEVIVEAAPWPDYVFEEGYDVPTFSEWEQHIAEKGHLPGLPSREKAEKEGVSVGEIQRALLEKIEEMSLMMIEREKELNTIIDSQNQRIDSLTIELQELQKSSL